MPIWVWYAKQPYGWTLTNLTSIPLFRFNMSEEQWVIDIEKYKKEQEEYKLNRFLNVLDERQYEIGLSAKTFEQLPKEAQMFIIKIFNKYEELEWRIDEIRSIIG